jgi:hypothetical protein
MIADCKRQRVYEMSCLLLGHLTQALVWSKPTSPPLQSEQIDPSHRVRALISAASVDDSRGCGGADTDEVVEHYRALTSLLA